MPSPTNEVFIVLLVESDWEYHSETIMGVYASQEEADAAILSYVYHQEKLGKERAKLIEKQQGILKKFQEHSYIAPKPLNSREARDKQRVEHYTKECRKYAEGTPDREALNKEYTALNIKINALYNTYGAEKIENYEVRPYPIGEWQE